jgi:hypothetical protein
MMLLFSTDVGAWQAGAKGALTNFTLSDGECEKAFQLSEEVLVVITCQDRSWANRLHSRQRRGSGTMLHDFDRRGSLQERP